MSTLKLLVQPEMKTAPFPQCTPFQRLLSVNVFKIRHLPPMKRELPSPALSTKYIWGSFIWITRHQGCHVLPPSRVFICQARFIVSRHRLSETILVIVIVCVSHCYREIPTDFEHSLPCVAQLAIRSFAISWMGIVI